MADTTVARSYAGALFEVARRHGEEEQYAESFRQLTHVLESERVVQRFLETPKIATKAKQEVVRQALEGRVAERFLRFVLVVVSKGRQRLLPQIRAQYQALLDEHAGRVHAQVTVAREPDAATERTVAERLSAMLGKTVEPHFKVEPAILGGLIVRYGDRVLDGSLRRQLVSLKRDMMHAHLPELPAASA